MSESQRSFAQLQNLLGAEQMHANAVKNIDALKDNYAEQKDQETNKIFENLGDTTGGILTTKGLDGKVIGKLKKKIIAKVGDKVGEQVVKSAEKRGYVKTAEFVNNVRKTGLKGAIKTGIQDAKAAAKAGVSDVVEDGVGAEGRAAVETLGQRGRGIARLFNRAKNLDMDGFHNLRNPFNALSGDQARVIQSGGGDGVPQLEAAAQDLQDNALAAAAPDAGVAGEAEGAAAVPEEVANKVKSIWDAGLFEPDDMDAPAQVAEHGEAQAAQAGEQAVEGGEKIAQAGEEVAEKAAPEVGQALDDAASAAKAGAAAAEDAVAGLSDIVGEGAAVEGGLVAVDAVDQEIPGLDVATDLATLAVGAGTIILGNLLKSKKDEASQSAQDALDQAHSMNVTGIGFDMGSK